MSIDNTLKQAESNMSFQLFQMEYTPTMKPDMAGQGLMKVLALNLSEHIAFFLSSHTESIIFRSSWKTKFSKMGENIRDGPSKRFTRS